MQSNFQFMESKWPDLAELGKDAESYLYSDPNSCLNKLGQLAEQLVRKLLRYGKLDDSDVFTHFERIESARQANLLPDHIYKILHTLRIERNDAEHKLIASTEQAKILLPKVYELCCWFMKQYGFVKNFKPAPYQEPKPRRIIDQCPDYLKSFIGRDAELEEIHEKLRGNNRVFITGDRGIGKTELAKYYANRYRDEYDVICFAEYPGSMEQLLAPGNLITIENDPEGSFTLASIADLLDERTLLIIDNYSVANDERLFDQLAAQKSKLLVSVAGNLQDVYDSSQIIEIGQLNSDEQYSLFEKEYGAPLSDEDRAVTKQILTEIRGYTLLIPLIAKLLNESCSLDFKDVLDRIKEAGSLSLAGEIRHKKDSKIHEGSIASIVRSVFDMSSLAENEFFVLQCIAVLTGIKIERAMLIGWIGEQYTKALNNLVRRRWINVEGAGKHALLYMHGIVRDVVNQNTSHPFDTSWVHKAVDDYIELTNSVFEFTPLSHVYPFPYFAFRGQIVDSRPSGVLGIQISKRRLLLGTLLQAIDIEREPETLVEILFSIINQDLSRAFNYAPDCDEQLNRIESSEIYEALTLGEQLQFHTIRIFLSLKTLCDCDRIREEDEVIALCRNSIYHFDRLLSLVSQLESDDIALSLSYGIFYKAFIIAGLSFGVFLFTTHYPDYSVVALNEYSKYVNQTAQSFFENYPEFFYEESEDDATANDNIINYFNSCMTPGNYDELWAEAYEINKAIEEAEEQEELHNLFLEEREKLLNTPDKAERAKYELRQKALTLQYEANELVKQCEQAGYHAVEDPEAHPEICSELLTNPVRLKKASELLNLAKRKFAAAALIEQQLYGSSDHADQHFDRSMFQWLSSACVYACCRGDYETAKQYYLNHLRADPIGLGLLLGGPKLKMYYTLKHLGFDNLALETLKINIQHLEEIIEKNEKLRGNPEIDWIYDTDKSWEAACKIIDCAELLGDSALKEKYSTFKQRLESAGFEFET